MYSTRPGLILGFHGCDESIVSDVISGKVSLRNSTNKYDWLGHGVYMWDNSPSRAMEFAEWLKLNPGKSKKPIKTPAVIGAVINLGFCLDLLAELDQKNFRNPVAFQIQYSIWLALKSCAKVMELSAEII